MTMEVINQSISVHFYLVFAMLFMIGMNLYFVITTKPFVVLGRYLKSVTPLFHSINAALAYTGIVAMAFNHDVRWVVVIMIPVTFVIMILEIIRRKKMRTIKSDEINKQKEFVKFARKIYIFDIALLVITFIVSELVLRF
jgi:hypothetical protein